LQGIPKCTQTDIFGLKYTIWQHWFACHQAVIEIVSAKLFATR
jgi:hypothetical protein